MQNCYSGFTLQLGRVESMDYKLGDFLKDQRKKADDSLRDYSNKIGISHTYLKTLEEGSDPRNGKPVAPSIETMVIISGYYGIPLFEVMKLAGIDVFSIKEGQPFVLGEELAKLIKIVANENNLNYREFALYFLATAPEEPRTITKDNLQRIVPAFKKLQDHIDYPVHQNGAEYAELVKSLGEGRTYQEAAYDGNLDPDTADERLAIVDGRRKKLEEKQKKRKK